ncbi:hypothetical protein GCM10018987_50190 [Streptomyces cremeus]
MSRRPGPPAGRSTSASRSGRTASESGVTSSGTASKTSPTHRSSSLRGCAVGVHNATGHACDPGTGSSPRRSAGTRPARSSEDLPAPDGAATTSGPVPARSASLASSAAVARCRPKNHRASGMSKEASPRYGHSPAEASAAAPAASGSAGEVRGAGTSGTSRSRVPPAPSTSSQRRATSQVGGLPPVSILLR